MSKINQRRNRQEAPLVNTSPWKSTLLVMLILFSVLASSFGVVYSTYKARVATRTLEDLRREANALQVMSGQYMLEKSSWAAYTRIEDVATKKLNMKVPQADDTVLVYNR